MCSYNLLLFSAHELYTWRLHSIDISASASVCIVQATCFSCSMINVLHDDCICTSAATEIQLEHDKKMAENPSLFYWTRHRQGACDYCGRNQCIASHSTHMLAKFDSNFLFSTFVIILLASASIHRKHLFRCNRAPVPTVWNYFDWFEYHIIIITVCISFEKFRAILFWKYFVAKQRV